MVPRGFGERRGVSPPVLHSPATPNTVRFQPAALRLAARRSPLAGNWVAKRAGRFSLAPYLRIRIIACWTIGVLTMNGTRSLMGAQAPWRTGWAWGPHEVRMFLEK